MFRHATHLAHLLYSESEYDLKHECDMSWQMHSMTFNHPAQQQTKKTPLMA